MHTLKSLRDEVLNWLDEAGDTSTTATNVNNALNQAHLQRVTEERWPFMLWSAPLTFSFVPSQQYYSLHQLFGRPLYFYNQNKGIFLRELPPRQLAESGVNWISDTNGATFVLQGVMAVQVQPTSSSIVTIVSSSASDNTTAKNVIVRGNTASGIATDTITPNGTTPVDGTVAFTDILSVSLSSVWAGSMTMTSNSAAVTNLTLLAGEYGRQYPRMRLLYLPDSADTIEYQFFRTPTVLSNDYDVPDIPYPYSGILVWDALMQLSAYDNEATAGRLDVWRDNQKRMDVQLRQAFLEGQSLGAQPRFVRDMTDEVLFYN